MAVQKCSKNTWDAFVDSSPQGTVFCKSYYLESYGREVIYLQSLRGEEVLGGLAFVKTSKGIEAMPFHCYCGIIFKDLSDLKTYRQNEIRFWVANDFAEYLFNNYDEVSIINHWDVIDIRAFEWFNYHEKEKGHYDVRIRYTSLLDISDPKDVSKYSEDKKLCIKRSRNFNIATKESSDIELLNILHDKTFARQGIMRTGHESASLLNICGNLIRNESGRLFVTTLDGKPASASFFAYDKRRAYHLFGATDPESRKFETGTRSLFDAFSHLRGQLGYGEVDFLGVNSPGRGGFKLSFGGKIVPYYMIRKIGKI